MEINHVKTDIVLKWVAFKEQNQEVRSRARDFRCC